MTPEFDFEKSAEAADLAVERSYAASLSSWRQAARFAAIRVAARGREFTVDDVWKDLDYRGVEFRPREPRAMGGILRSLASSGVIHAVGYAKTSQVSGHSRPISLWKKKEERVP